MRHGGDAYSAEDANNDDDYHEELQAQVKEEAEPARPLPIPEMPTRSEFLDHCVAHCSYRTW